MPTQFHLKIYSAKSKKPKGNPSPIVLVFLDEIFTWGFGYYDARKKNFIVAPMHTGFKPLYWMLVPPVSLDEIHLLASM